MKKLFLLSLSLCIFLNGNGQWSCSSAINISNGFTSGQITSPGTSTNSTESWVSSVSTDGNTSSTGFTYPDVYTFKYTTGSTAGESFYFTISCDYLTDGEHSIGVWTGCSGSTLSSCIVSTYKFDNVLGICAKNLLANTSYYIGVGKEWASSANTNSGIASRKLKFQVIDFTVESSSTIPSDDCSLASTINISNPYSGSTRCNYSASAGSPSVCGMSIENDSWMKFTAGSSEVVIDYEVYNCTNDYGVQLAIFSGTCGALTLIPGSCVNYAPNNAGGTWNLSGLTIGQTYYIRTDGYAGDLCSYSFSPIEGVVMLPLDLIEFQAINLDNGYNKIQWKTQSEYQVDKIILQKTVDNALFLDVKTIPVFDNSITSKTYVEYDRNSSENEYYRLEMIDRDGKRNYSPLISVQNTKNLNQISIYPNPTNDGKLFFESSETTKIEIVDLLGNKKDQFHVQKNEKYTLSIIDYPKGIYFALIENREGKISKKIDIK